MTDPSQPSLFPELTTRAERRVAKRNPEPTFDAISMGAGVQGTTIALLIAHGRLPAPQYAVFADTGWEPKQVYRQLRRIATELLEPNGVQLVQVSDGNIRDDLLDPHYFGKIPAFTRPRGQIRRTCTPFYKLAPIFRWHRLILGAPSKTIVCPMCQGAGRRAAPWLIRFRNDHTIGECSGCHGSGAIVRVGAPPAGEWVRSWVGFSVDEMERCGPSKVPYSENWYPLLEDGIRFSRDDCEEYLAAHGFGEVVKSACIGCPYHHDADWLDMKTNRPEEWAEAVEVDAALRREDDVGLNAAYLHASRVPLPLVALNGAPVDLDRESPSCSPYGCRSGDPLEEPPLWDELP